MISMISCIRVHVGHSITVDKVIQALRDITLGLWVSCVERFGGLLYGILGTAMSCGLNPEALSTTTFSSPVASYQEHMKVSHECITHV